MQKRSGMKSFQSAVMRLRSNFRGLGAINNPGDYTNENKRHTVGKTGKLTCNMSESFCPNEDKLIANKIPREECVLRHESLISEDSASSVPQNEIQPAVNLPISDPPFGATRSNDNAQSNERNSKRCEIWDDIVTNKAVSTCRVHKKALLNGKFAVYLTNRDLVMSGSSVTPLQGVFTLDPKETSNKQVFAQIVMIFRYGRDDEEIMGLKLSNESVLCMERIYPLKESSQLAALEPAQEMLLQRLGPNAYPLTLKINQQVPPSVRLHPAKEYKGAAIGISYHLIIFTAESDDPKAPRKSMFRMTLRLIQFVTPELLQAPTPKTCTEKHFLLREGSLALTVTLDRPWFPQGLPVNVTVNVSNKSSRTIRKVRVYAVQHVDVSMFSNGRFKNVISSFEETPASGSATSSFEKRYSLSLAESYVGHWVALEDQYGRLTSHLASTTLKTAPTERNFFAIYVNYYVKVRLTFSGVGQDVTAKVPFVLIRDGPDLIDADSAEPDKKTDCGVNGESIGPSLAENGQTHSTST